MKHIVFRLNAGDSANAMERLIRAGVVVGLLAGFLVITSIAASTVPHFGGTLRVEMSERIATIDPRQWPSAPGKAAAAERVDSLVFDRLARLDGQGTLQPALAISWQHDAQSKQWQFRLREGVKFSDGTPLTPTVAALALQQLLGISFDVSATSDSVVIQGEHPLPGLLSELATGRYFIFHSGEDNSLMGTGPFRVSEWITAGVRAQALFIANENCWAGRPFLDKIEIVMGADSQQQVNAISFGQADVVELSASQVRRTAQRGVRTASSDPVELFVLVFDASRTAVRDARLRQAISLSVDRSSIADVILQKQGVSAGGLLPNWISGYAHLFPVSSDLPRAKDLLAATGRELSRSMPLVLFYDSSDAEAQAVADRVAVNLREIGIMVQVSGQITDGKTKLPAPDLRLVRHRITSPDPAAALSELLNSLGEAATDLETPEQIYAAERGPIDAFRVIPLVHVSESYGLSPQVRDWMAPRWGGWNLADVWLGPPASGGGNSP
jgi:peptide/nickel transport system substrate-binding protein